MKLSEIGEFGFIRRICPPFLKNLPSAIVGIGDDCAVIPWKEDTSLLVTTDMLIEDIHFLRKKIPPRDLGYKSLAVNLSDIAAMGGKPTSAYISIGIPRDVDVELLDEFYAGLRELANSTSVHLLGGDTTKSPNHLVVNIAVIGEMNTSLVKYRSSAKIGDTICVTGYLGDSGSGLKILLEDKHLNEDAVYLINEHHRPRPHLREGAWLAQHEGVHAMMDVSDGIDSDLHRIMERSICGADVRFESLPISPQLQRVAAQYGWNAIEIAATGGEDYCLLVTIAPNRYSTIAQEFEKEFKRPLVNIGIIVNKGNKLTYFKYGEKTDLLKNGYDHFG